MNSVKLSVVAGLSMLCLCCSHPATPQPSVEILLAKELCKTPGLSIIRVEETNESGVAWGRPDRPFLQAEAVELNHLLEVAFGFRRSRFDLRAKLPEGYFNVVLPADPEAQEADAFPRKQLSKAFREAFGLSLTLATANLEVLVLTVPGNGLPRGLVPVPDDVSHFEGTLPPGYRVTGGTIESLRDRMERAIKIPVINETGLKGKFDYSIAKSFDMAGSPEAVVQMAKNLGFEVTSAHRQIQILEVNVTSDTAGNTTR